MLSDPGTIWQRCRGDRGFNLDELAFNSKESREVEFGRRQDVPIMGGSHIATPKPTSRARPSKMRVLFPGLVRIDQPEEHESGHSKHRSQGDSENPRQNHAPNRLPIQLGLLRGPDADDGARRNVGR